MDTTDNMKTPQLESGQSIFDTNPCEVILYVQQKTPTTPNSNLYIVSPDCLYFKPILKTFPEICRLTSSLTHQNVKIQRVLFIHTVVT